MRPFLYYEVRVVVDNKPGLLGCPDMVDFCELSDMIKKLMLIEMCSVLRIKSLRDGKNRIR